MMHIWILLNPYVTKYYTSRYHVWILLNAHNTKYDSTVICHFFHQPILITANMIICTTDDTSSDQSCMLIIFLILVHMMQEDACLIRFIRYHINCLILMRLYYYILIDLLAVSIQRIHSVRDNVAILETNHKQLINSNFNQETIFISKLLHFAIKT